MMKMTWKGGLLVAPLAILAIGALLAGCSKDPFGENAGTPVAIQPGKSLVNEKIGSKFSVTATVVDARMTPLVKTLTVTSSNAGAVVVDSVVFSSPLSQTQAYLRAAGTKTDSSTVTFSNGSLSGTTKVIVTP
ncbi:MAG TPA: hypothetical protein VF832_06425 [Longimicrobiales bacterium]